MKRYDWKFWAGVLLFAGIGGAIGDRAGGVFGMAAPLIGGAIGFLVSKPKEAK